MGDIIRPKRPEWVNGGKVAGQSRAAFEAAHAAMPTDRAYGPAVFPYAENDAVEFPRRAVMPGGCIVIECPRRYEWPRPSRAALAAKAAAKASAVSSDLFSVPVALPTPSPSPTNLAPLPARRAKGGPRHTSRWPSGPKSAA